VNRKTIVAMAIIITALIALLVNSEIKYRNIINESHITKVTLVDAIKTGVGLRNPGSSTSDPDVFGSIISSSEQDRGMTIEFIARKPVAVGLVKDDKEFKTFIVNPGDRLKVNSNGEIVP
jgi:hypothetical protein